MAEVKNPVIVPPKPRIRQVEQKRPDDERDYGYKKKKEPQDESLDHEENSQESSRKRDSMGRLHIDEYV